MDKTILLGKDLLELSDICIKNDLPKFHGEQLYKWMYQKATLNINDMSNIPIKLKKIISGSHIISVLTTEKKFNSHNEDTVKYLFKTSDNKLIESVSMIDNKRHTLCISSQIGCSVDCDFCATAKMGIIRNLDCGEIIQQLIIISNERELPITNIVFMGMGEPFLNYKNVIKSCKIMNDSKGFNLSSKKITISTSGPERLFAIADPILVAPPVIIILFASTFFYLFEPLFLAFPFWIFLLGTFYFLNCIVLLLGLV